MTLTALTTSPRSVAFAGHKAMTLPARFDVHQVEGLETRVRQVGLERGDVLELDGSEVLHADRSALAALESLRNGAATFGAYVRVVRSSLALRLAVEFDERARGLGVATPSLLAA